MSKTISSILCEREKCSNDKYRHSEIGKLGKTSMALSHSICVSKEFADILVARNDFLSGLESLPLIEILIKLSRVVVLDTLALGIPRSL